MYVFREPVGRELVAQAALPGFAIDDRAGGGELIAEAKIVQETGDVLLFLPARYFAGNQVGQRGKIEFSFVRARPSLALGMQDGLRQVGAQLHDRPVVTGMNDNLIRPLYRRRIDLRLLDRAQMD